MATKMIRLLAAGIPLCCLLALKASAGEPTPATVVPVNPWLFRTNVFSQRGDNVFPTRCATLSIGTNQFAFLLPLNSQLESSDQSRVVVASRDHSRTFTISINSFIPAGVAPPDPEACHASLATEFPGSTIQSESGTYVANQSGWVFDVRWNASTNNVRVARVAYVPSLAGVLEFSMVSSLAKSVEANADFNFMMLSFRASGPDGKIVFPSLSSKF